MAADIISEIAVRLGLDTDGLENDVKSTNRVINELSKQFKYLDKAMAGSMNEIDRLGDITKTLTAKLDATKNAFKQVQRTVSDTQAEISRLVDKKRQLNAANEAEAAQIREIDARLEQYNQTLTESRNAATRFGASITSTERDLQRYDQRLRNTQQGLDLFGRAAQELGTDMQELSNRLDLNIDTADVRTLQSALSSLRADTNSLTPEIQRLIDQFAALGNRADRTRQDLNGLEDGLGQIGNRMDASIAVDALGEISDIVGETSRKIVDFGKESTLSFANFQTTVVGAVMKTDEGIQALDSSMTELERLGAEFPVTNAELATSFDDLSAAGFNTSKSIDILEGSLNVSMAVGEELEQVVDSTASSFALFGDQVEDVSELQDIMAKAANLGKISFEDLGKQLVKVGGNANNLGMDVEDVSAILAELSNEGLTAEATGEKLNSMLRQLSNPSKKAKEELADLNVEVFDADGKFRGFTTVMGELNEATKGMTDEQKNLTMATLFGADASSAASSFMEKGIDNTEQYGVALKDTTGYVDELTQAIKDNSAYDEIQGLVGAFDSLKAAVGKAILPILQTVLPIITDLIQGFLDLPDPMKNTIIILAMVAGIVGVLIAALSPLLMNIVMLQQLLSGGIGTGAAMTGLKGVVTAVTGMGKSLLGLIGGPITLVIAAIAGIVYALGTNVDVLQWLTDEWGVFGSFLSAMLEQLAGICQLFIGNILILIMTLGKMLLAVVTGNFSKVDDIWSEGWAKIENNTAEALSNINGETSKALELMKTLTQTEMNGVTNTFEMALKELPKLTADNADKVAEAFRLRMGTLNDESLTILRGTSDSMAVIFDSIYEGMSDEQASKQFTANLESMAKSGKYPMEEVEKDIAQALETINKNVVDGGVKVKKSAEEVFSNFGTLGQVGIDAMTDNVVSSLSKMDARTVEQLAGMSGAWGEIFSDLTINGEEKIDNLDQVISARIKDMAEKNPKFVEQMEKEMTEYFGKTKEGAEKGMNETVEAVTVKGEELKEAGKGAGKKGSEGVEEGLKENQGIEEAINLVKEKIETSDLETSGKTTGAKAGKGINDGIKEGSAGTKETVDGVKDTIMQIDGVKLGSVTKQLSEVNRWCGVVSSGSEKARTNMQRLTNLPFGNTTKGLSEINRWLTTVNQSAKTVQSSLKNLVAVTYGLTTKGLSEVDKWLKTVERASKWTRDGLKGINLITYGAATKGLSEINRWLTTCKTSANTLTSALQNISNVRFVGTINSLNSLRSALQSVAIQASSTKIKVASVSSTSSSAVVADNTQQVQQTGDSSLLMQTNAANTQFYDTLDLAKAAQKDIIGIMSAATTSQSITAGSGDTKLLQEQNQLLKTMISTMQDMYQDVNLSVDGKQFARATVRYMQSELKTVDNRSSRLGTVL